MTLRLQALKTLRCGGVEGLQGLGFRVLGLGFWVLDPLNHSEANLSGKVSASLMT